MKRRDAIMKSLVGLGGVVSASSLHLLVSCSESPPDGSFFLFEKETKLLTLLVDTILPATDTPSASQAGTVAFIDIALVECFVREQQSLFRDGLKTLQKKKFMQLTNEQQLDMLGQMEAQDDRFFSLLKELTLVGYFTSEVGIKENYSFQPVPGKFEGCIPFGVNDKAWRGNSL